MSTENPFAIFTLFAIFIYHLYRSYILVHVNIIENERAWSSNRNGKFKGTRDNATCGSFVKNNKHRKHQIQQPQDSIERCVLSLCMDFPVGVLGSLIRAARKSERVASFTFNYN